MGDRGREGVDELFTRTPPAGEELIPLDWIVLI